VRVVCAACLLHYADLEDSLPFAEKIVWSDSLAEWHGPNCTATRDEHQAALQMMQAVEAVEAS
jgi:hypothetical protein